MHILPTFHFIFKGGSMKRKFKQKGFTLIELVMVIVILGVLSAVAIPKFVDVAGDAGDASAKGVAAEINTATKLNFAKGLSSGTAPTTIGAATVCSGLTALLEGGLPADISYVDGTAALGATCTKGAVVSTCMIKSAKGGTPAGFAVSAVCTG